MERGCTYVKSLLKYTLPFLYAHIVMLPYLSGLSRFTQAIDLRAEIPFLSRAAAELMSTVIQTDELSVVLW